MSSLADANVQSDLDIAPLLLPAQVLRNDAQAIKAAHELAQVARVQAAKRDRQRKLVAKIDSALRRIDSGDYGYCEVTGDPIGLRRLIARPVATMTVEAQEAHERREKISRDD